MKKIALSLCLLSLPFFAYTQPKVGLTFSPSMSISRVKYKSATTEDFANDGVAVRFKLGLEVDFPLADNYSFSTGLIYAPKRAGYTATGFSGATVDFQDYRVQYLQIPITLKLYTSEIQPDIKAFFQLGFLAEVKLFSESLQEYAQEWVEKFTPYDVSFIFAVGVEYGAGINSILYASIFYNRGLVNVVARTNEFIPNDLVTKLDMVGLQLGIKF